MRCRDLPRVPQIPSGGGWDSNTGLLTKPQPGAHSKALRKREMKLENNREETLGLT